MSEQVTPGVDDNPAAEWLKFGGLVFVLLAVIALTLLLRPLLFERMIPRALGLEQPAAQMESVESERAVSVETAGRLHVVQPGETLPSIASLYGVSVDELAAANRIVNPFRLRVGTDLVIPIPQR
ncbi:MAG: LysM domain-containing protein [Candidatus Promineifilaceae bacterium]|nr:LysM domain-containing protein [Candidatus Promineifilaceae bacterium]